MGKSNKSTNKIDLIYNFCREQFKTESAFLSFFENYYVQFYDAFIGKRKLNREEALDLLISHFHINPNELNI